MKSATILVQKLHDWFVNSVSNLQSLFSACSAAILGLGRAFRRTVGRSCTVFRVLPNFLPVWVCQPPVPPRYSSLRRSWSWASCWPWGCSRASPPFALTIDMIVAYITADRVALHSFFSDPGKFYNADPYTFLFAALLILIFGPGRFSVDLLVEHLVRKPKVPEAQVSAI